MRKANFWHVICYYTYIELHLYTFVLNVSCENKLKRRMFQ
jgi:hypothetical protein